MRAHSLIVATFAGALLMAVPQAASAATVTVDIANQTGEKVRISQVRYTADACASGGQCSGEVRGFSNQQIDPGRSRTQRASGARLEANSKVQVEVRYSCVGNSSRRTATSRWLGTTVRATIRNCDGDVSFSR